MQRNNKRRETYVTRFVDKAPMRDIMEEGVVYVLPQYGCALHKCMCGCGELISTPLDEKHGWSWTFDNVNVSLNPSVGNFSYPCKSHYFLKNGNVEWCK